MHKNEHLIKAVADFYENHGGSFGRTRRGVWGIMHLIVSRLHPADILIDVGGGNARLARFLPKDISYIDIEPSRTLCEDGREVLRMRGEGEIRQGGFPVLPAKNNEADIVTCLAVLHHIPGSKERQDAVRELCRIMKPGSTLVLTVWNLRSIRFAKVKTWLASWLRMPLVKGGGCGDVWIPWKAEGVTTQRYVHAFTTRELRKLFLQDWEIEICRSWRDTNPASVFQGVNLVLVAKKK